MGIAAFIWAMGSMFQLTAIRMDARDSAVLDQIEVTYGEELKSLRGLDYPNEKPTEDFEVFGSYSRDEPTAAGFERTETFLVWKDGQMILASSADGEVFDELER